MYESARQTAEELRCQAEEIRQMVQEAAVALRQVAEVQFQIGPKPGNEIRT